MKFQGRTNSKRELDIRWDLVNLYLKKWIPGTVLDIEITRRQKKRSDPLRKYYFAAVLPPFMEHLGYEKDEEVLFHHQLKATYFKRSHEVYRDKRGIMRNVPSVFGNDSDMDVSVKKKYVDWVIRKAAENGVIIQDPKGN